MAKLKIIALIITIALFGSISKSYAQEENLIKTTINNLFDGMRKSDSTLIKSAFSETAILQTILTNKSGKTLVKTEDLAKFIKSVSTPYPEIYDERIEFTNILIDDNLASVWTNYKFYIGDKFSHCGVNSFQLVKQAGLWKIVYLIDTRRKDNCK